MVLRICPCAVGITFSLRSFSVYVFRKWSLCPISFRISFAIISSTQVIVSYPFPLRIGYCSSFLFSISVGLLTEIILSWRHETKCTPIVYKSTLKIVTDLSECVRIYFLPGTINTLANIAKKLIARTWKMIVNGLSGTPLKPQTTVARKPINELVINPWTMVRLISIIFSSIYLLRFANFLKSFQLCAV